MTRIFSHTQPLDADIVDAFCLLQKGFTDQFVYYRKDRPTRFMGLGLSLIHISEPTRPLRISRMPSSA